MAIGKIRNLGGGTSKSKYAFIPTHFIEGDPSPATGAPTNRIWTKSSYTNGLTYNNNFWKGNIGNISITTNNISWTPAYAEYGLNFVLPQLKRGNYKIKCRELTNTIVSMNKYATDGTFLGNVPVPYENGYLIFEVETNVEYNVLLFGGTVAYSRSSCTFE